jgi:HK97 family phage major capsid protein
MDWTKVLGYAKKVGFTGSDTDAGAVKEYLASKSIILANADGSDVDLVALCADHQKAATEVVAETKSIETLQQENEVLKEQARKNASAIVNAGAIPASIIKEKTMNSDISKKMYDKKPKKAFVDADQAEAFAASTRLAMMGGKNYGQKANDLEIAKKAQVEYSNTLGGFLVPEEFVAQLVYLTEPVGVARKISNVVRMSRDLQRIPRKTGIATMSWVGEGQAGTVADNGYDQVELAARKLQLLMQASNELLEDSAVNIADDLANSMREAYDKAIDESYFNGDGTSTYGGYLGLKNALPSSAYVAASGTAWSNITASDFTGALGVLQNVNSARIAMVCSRQFFFQVMLRLEKATSQFKELAGPALAGADASFLGYPVYFSQVMPTASAATTSSVYLGDFVGGSMVGERRDLTIASSEHAAFSSDSWQWRATARASVNIHGDGKASTYGPIVAIKTT